MITSVAPQLKIPHEMRVTASRGLEQAKLAFKAYMQVVEGVASMFEERIEASQGAKVVTKTAIRFALQSATMAFEFAEKIAQAKDVPEFVRLLSEFLQAQMQLLSDQAKDLGEALGNAAMGSTKVSDRSKLVS
jgi:hypothetical protein